MPSVDDSSSTPGRAFPKPLSSAFGSSGLLQKKTKGIFEQTLTSGHTPDTPSKIERSKFVAPINLTPFALSPKVISKLTDELAVDSEQRRTVPGSTLSAAHSLRIEDSCLLSSPCLNTLGRQASSIAEKSSFLSEAFSESFDGFMDASFGEDIAEMSCDDTSMCSRSLSVSADSECPEMDCPALSYIEPWKSPSVGFIQGRDAILALICKTSTEIDSDPDFFNSQFEILETLGHGSFSTVYKVCPKQASDNFVFALKKAKSPSAGQADRLSKMKEVESLYLVKDCEHCVQMIGAWEQSGYLFILTEFCLNGSLQSLMDRYVERNERFTEQVIWYIAHQCCMALEYLHGHELIHLDLKPENILIDADEQLKLADFGLATATGVPPSLHSEGDKYYMAPEILEGIYSKAADVFSFGLILLELATNVQLPPHGDSWQYLRHGDFSELSFEDTSDALTQLIKEMTHPEAVLRPSIEKVVLHVHFLEAFPEKIIVGIDQDEASICTVANSAREFIECQRLLLKCGRFSQMQKLLASTCGSSATAGLILFDLGYSNAQVLDYSMGLSYFRDMDLNMRLDRKDGPSAADVLNLSSKDKLVELLRDNAGFGAEAFSIARAIVRERSSAQIETTQHLVAVLQKACGSSPSKLAKVFQALRMAVNNDVAELRKGLEDATHCLDGQGLISSTLADFISGYELHFVSIVAICFNELEQRTVVKAMKELGFKKLRTDLPQEDELRDNYSARSAKLFTFIRRS